MGENDKVHIGKNISLFRELKDMKQTSLALKLGVSQQTVSSIENIEVVDEERLDKISAILGVDKDIIKNISKNEILSHIVETKRSPEINKA